MTHDLVLAALAQAVGARTTHPSTVDAGTVTLGHRHGSYLYAPVSVGGTPPGWFILDTGGARSFLTKRGYERLRAAGVPLRPEGSPAGLAVDLGGVSLGRERFALATSVLRSSPDPSCDGIIGIAPLSRCRIGIDLRRGQLRFWSASAPIGQALKAWFAPTATPNPADLWPLYAGGPFLVQVDADNLSVPMTLDTGSPGTYLSRELAPALPGKSQKGGRIVFPYRTFPGGASAQVEERSTRRYAVGGVALRAEYPLSVVQLSEDSGLLGCDVLESIRALVDFQGRRIYVASSGGPASRAVPKAPSDGGPIVSLPTGVTIRWPKGVVVRVEPGCDYRNASGYRRVRRPDGTLDLVPGGRRVPQFRPLPPMLLVPTVGGEAKWADEAVRVSAGARYTAPPGWRRRRNRDGSIDLIPPEGQGG